MLQSYPKPAVFDGQKFSARYNLVAFPHGDWWADTNLVYLKPGIVLPDDPPIFEAPDPPAVRQTKFNAGAANRNPGGFIESARGKFIPYFD